MNKTRLYNEVCDITLDKQTKDLSSEYLKELETCKINEEDGFKIIKQLLSYVDSGTIADKRDIINNKSKLVALVSRINRYTVEKEKGTINIYGRKNLEVAERIASKIFKKNYLIEEEIIRRFFLFKAKPKRSSSSRSFCSGSVNSGYDSGEHRIFGTLPGWVPSNNRPSRDRDYINSFYY